MKSMSCALDEPVEVPAQSPLLAVGQRHVRHLAQLRNIHQRVLVTHRVLDEERVERLHDLADPHGVVEVEALVQVDAPVAVGAHRVAYVAAVLFDAADHRAGVEDRPDRHVARAHAKRPVAGFHRRVSPLFQAEGGVGRGTRRSRAAGRVALAVVARQAAEQLVHRQAERLALDVPQREIEGAEGVGLLPARRVEPRDVGLLPDPLDPKGILANQRARDLLEGVPGAALADAGDADVGFNGHHHVALVEQRVEVGRTEDPDASDGGLGQRCRCRLRPHRAKNRCSRQRGQEGSSIHLRFLHTTSSTRNP